MGRGSGGGSDLPITPTSHSQFLLFSLVAPASLCYFYFKIKLLHNAATFLTTFVVHSTMARRERGPAYASCLSSPPPVPIPPPILSSSPCLLTHLVQIFGLALL